MGWFLPESGSDRAWKPLGLSFLLCHLSLQTTSECLWGGEGAEWMASRAGGERWGGWGCLCVSHDWTLPFHLCSGDLGLPGPRWLTG